jgi:hypothetical protein
MRNLDYMIAVMQAAKEGKRIQYWMLGVWHDCVTTQDVAGLEWNWGQYDYRIAPEPRKPRECWVAYGSDGHVASVLESPLRPWGTDVALMREVLPEHES